MSVCNSIRKYASAWHIMWRLVRMNNYKSARRGGGRAYYYSTIKLTTAWISTIYRQQSVWPIAILNTVSEDDKRWEGLLCSKSTTMLLCVGCVGGLSHTHSSPPLHLAYSKHLPSWTLPARSAKPKCVIRRNRGYGPYNNPMSTFTSAPKEITWRSSRLHHQSSLRIIFDSTVCTHISPWEILWKQPMHMRQSCWAGLDGAF